ncbi:MAG: hypothetical protein R2793_04125 [Flavobacteriaceae bacterium]
MNKFILSFLGMLLFFSSCSNNNDDSNNNQGIFRATINGELWEAEVFSETNGLIQVTQFNEQLFQLQGDSNGIRLRVAISQNSISECINTGNYAFPNRVDIYYQIGEDSYLSGHMYDEDANGNEIMTLTVTSCSNNRISGTFSGSYSGDSGPDSPANVVITDGVFENIEFEIFQQ